MPETTPYAPQQEQAGKSSKPLWLIVLGIIFVVGILLNGGQDNDPDMVLLLFFIFFLF